MAQSEASSMDSYDSIQQVPVAPKEPKKSHKPGHHHHHHHHSKRIHDNGNFSCRVNNSAPAHSFYHNGEDLFGKTRIFPQPMVQRNLSQHSCHGFRQHQRLRQNVAVATQVINPSAIGGSLKVSGMRTLSSRYELDSDGEDDDKRRLFGKRSRIHWDAVGCYTVAIGFVLLVLTGVILAVGYMQSERQRASSAQKLYQQEYTVNGTTVTFALKNQTFFNHSSVPIDSAVEETAIHAPDVTEPSSVEVLAVATTQVFETSGDTTINPAEFIRFPTSAEENETEDLAEGRNIASEEKFQDFDTSSETTEAKELEIHEPTNLSQEGNASVESANVISSQSEVKQLAQIHSKEAHLLELSETKNNSDKGGEHEWPAQVKVLPPKGFTFHSSDEKELRLPEINDLRLQARNSTIEQVQENLESKQEKELANLLLSPSTYLGSTSSFSIPIYGKGNSSSASATDSRIEKPFDSPFLNGFDFTSKTNATKSIRTQQQDLQATKATDFILPVVHHFKSSTPAQDDSQRAFSSGTAQDSVAAGDVYLRPEAESRPKANEDENSHLGNSESVKLQTELFTLDDDLPKSTEYNDVEDSEDGESDEDDEDSAMSASNKMAPPSAAPIDIMYTPAGNSRYPYKSSRPYSAKTGGFSNGGSPMKYPSNMSEVRVQPPPSFAPKPHSALQPPIPPKSNAGRDYPGSGRNFASSAKKEQIVEVNRSGSFSNKLGYDQQQAGDNVTGHDKVAHSTPTSTESYRTTLFDLSAFKTHSSQAHASPENKVTGVSFPDFSTTTGITTENPLLSTKNPYIIDSNTPSQFDFSQFTTTAPSADHSSTPSLSTTDFQLKDFSGLNAVTPAATPSNTADQNYGISTDSLSKRTFNFDFDNFGNTPAASTNPFASILGNQASVTGVIGSASSTGANLGYSTGGTYNYDNYNFDNPSVTNLNIPAGSVPIDLASSFISVSGGPKPNSGGQGSGSYDFSTSYTHNNPTLALANLIQNGAGGGGSGNQAPDYNTITQGIHLLSLLSGKIPDHLSDSQTSASNFHAVQHQSAGLPEYQIAALTGYGGSSNAFLSNLPSQSNVGAPQTISSSSNQFASSNNNVNAFLPVESRSLSQPFSSDSQSSNTYGISAPQVLVDQHTSFSQNIVTKAADFSKLLQKSSPTNDAPKDSETSETKEARTTVTAPVAENPKFASRLVTASQAAAELRRILDLPKTKNAVVPIIGLQTESMPAAPLQEQPRTYLTSALSKTSTDMETAGSELQPQLLQVIKSTDAVDNTVK